MKTKYLCSALKRIIIIQWKIYDDWVELLVLGVECNEHRSSSFFIVAMESHNIFL